MAKYSYEFKKKLVDEYLSGQGSQKSICSKYGIPDKSILKRWIYSYNALGKEGLLRSRKSKNYSFEFKQYVVQLYLTSKCSYQEIAIQNGINNPSLIFRWVKEYRLSGPAALRKKRKGRIPLAEKSKKDREQHEVAIGLIDTSEKHVKELEEEILKLRIENAFLKELRRLRLREQALQKKQRELSAASEENSD